MTAKRGNGPMFQGFRDSAKKENADPRPKLLLRRHFLDAYHADAAITMRHGRTERPPQVFDACQAGGALWGVLRREYDVRYWGVDLKPQKKGTLAIDSARVLAQPGLPFDVIDIDTFGSPWDHWLVMLPNLRRRPVTVFLTLGQAGGMNDVGNDALHWLGLGKLTRHLPPALRWKLAAHEDGTLLSACTAYGFRIVEAQEATRTKNARYLGVRLEPEV